MFIRKIIIATQRHCSALTGLATIFFLIYCLDLFSPNIDVQRCKWCNSRQIKYLLQAFGDNCAKNKIIVAFEVFHAPPSLLLQEPSDSQDHSGIDGCRWQRQLDPWTLWIHEHLFALNKRRDYELSSKMSTKRPRETAAVLTLWGTEGPEAEPELHGMGPTLVADGNTFCAWVSFFL